MFSAMVLLFHEDNWVIRLHMDITSSFDDATTVVAGYFCITNVRTFVDFN
jgi:hypothetical protein